MTIQQIAWAHILLQMRLANRGNMDRAIAEKSLDGWFTRCEADLIRWEDGRKAIQQKT